MGDLALPAFRLAKELHLSPQKIAKDCTNAIILLKEKSFECEASGAYVNVRIDRAALAREVLGAALAAGERYGFSDDGSGKTVVIDFSSPNTAKHFHLGHLRSTVIGAALGRLFRAQGYRVVGINYLGDWGTQFGKLIVAFRKWGEEARLEAAPVAHLNDLYVRFHEEAEREAGLEDEARAAFKALEAGDAEARALWERFRAASLAEFEKVYARLGVSFEVLSGESEYAGKPSQDVASLLEGKQVAGYDERILFAERRPDGSLLEESRGALIVNLEDEGLKVCLIRKADGATLYATRDLAAAIDRYREYKFARMLYVVGADQRLHFRQVFRVLERMGCEWAARCKHVDFGMMRFKDGAMSSREGKVVLLSEVLDRAAARAREIIDEKNPELANKDAAAEAVGVGAILFEDLARRRVKDVAFYWETALSFDGETGPYLQYTRARAASVLRKAGREAPEDFDASLLAEDEAAAALAALSAWPEALRRAADECEPCIAATALVEVASTFNNFYNACRILVTATDITVNAKIPIDATRISHDPNRALSDARLALTKATLSVLTAGLGILGITPLEEM